MEVAEYFEAKGALERAVQLYEKGGDIARALDVCFQSRENPEMFEILNNLLSKISHDSSIQVLSRCAEFFINNGQHQKAMKLYIDGKNYEMAVDLCLDNDVMITEEIYKMIAPPKGEIPDSRRKDFLMKIAKGCKKQQSYRLGCKIYTEV